MSDDQNVTEVDHELEDRIINARIAGKSPRAIARTEGMSVADVNAVLDRFTDHSIDQQIRKRTVALELARLDLLQQAFFKHALEGNLGAGALVQKIIERRCIILGLHTPQTATIQVVDQVKQTNTDKIEAALNALIADQRDKPKPN